MSQNVIYKSSVSQPKSQWFNKAGPINKLSQLITVLTRRIIAEVLLIFKDKRPVCMHHLQGRENGSIDSGLKIFKRFSVGFLTTTSEKNQTWKWNIYFYWFWQKYEKCMLLIQQPIIVLHFAKLFFCTTKNKYTTKYKFISNTLHQVLQILFALDTYSHKTYSQEKFRNGNATNAKRTWSCSSQAFVSCRWNDIRGSEWTWHSSCRNLVIKKNELEKHLTTKKDFAE